jgi:hypothetical protein
VNATTITVVRIGVNVSGVSDDLPARIVKVSHLGVGSDDDEISSGEE